MGDKVPYYCHIYVCTKAFFVIPKSLSLCLVQMAIIWKYSPQTSDMEQTQRVFRSHSMRQRCHIQILPVELSRVIVSD